MNLATLLIIMMGGALGTGARYVIGWLMLPASAKLPWSTIVINITGSLLIGLIGTLTLSGSRFAAPEWLRLFLMVGFCGGYTTFSAFSLQTFDLIRSGGVARAGVNVAVSVLFCIAAVGVGHMLGAYLNGHAIGIAQTAMEEDA